MQRSRRYNPYPWTWEIPAAVTCAMVLALALGVHVGRGFATLTAGAGWMWPSAVMLFRSVPAVLGGDATAGLAATAISSVAVVDQGSLLWWVAAAELVTLALLAMVGFSMLRDWGPGRLKGMATRDQAERLLGVSRLRRVRHVIRPDLRLRRTPARGARR